MGQLRKQIVTGMSWVTLYIYVVRIIGFLATLVLAKLLTPEDFGLVAIGVLVIETSMIFGKFGIGQALIYRKDQIEPAANAAFFLVMGFNLLLVTGLILGAPWIGNFFNSPTVVPIIVWLSLTMLPNAVKIIPTVLLEKELKFKRLVLPEVIPAVVSAVGSIVAAVMGAGVWSLVIRQILYSFLGLVMVWWISPLKIRFQFDWKIFREIVDYGKHMITVSLLLLVLYNIDNMIVGKIVGTTALGFYVLAFRIANLPVQEGSHVISKVMFPVFSKIRHDRTALRDGFLKVMKFVSAFCAPVALGMALYTPDLIRMIYGEKWLDTILPLQILTAYGFIRALGVPGGEIMKSIGKPKYITYTVLIMLAVIFPFVLPVAKKSGIVGISVLMSVAMLVGNLFALSVTAHFLKLKFKEMAYAILSPLWLAGVTISLGFLPYYLGWFPHSLGFLIICILMSSGFYFIAFFYLEAKFRQELLAMAGFQK
jgi:O-antigen/teichoic acid export membrane protein